MDFRYYGSIFISIFLSFHYTCIFQGGWLKIGGLEDILTFADAKVWPGRGWRQFCRGVKRSGWSKFLDWAGAGGEVSVLGGGSFLFVVPTLLPWNWLSNRNVIYILPPNNSLLSLKLFLRRLVRNIETVF